MLAWRPVLLQKERSNHGAFFCLPLGPQPPKPNLLTLQHFLKFDQAPHHLLGHRVDTEELVMDFLQPVGEMDLSGLHSSSEYQRPEAQD